MIGGTVYCADTSALVDAHRRCYPPRAFVGLWNKIDELIEEGRFISPEEVWKELEERGDDLTRWAKERAHMFIRPDYHQTSFMTRVAVDYPELIRSSVLEHRADPWVVALAHTRPNHIVVSAEKGEAARIPKIPQMCRRYTVTHLPLVNVIVSEGWVFP